MLCTLFKSVALFVRVVHVSILACSISSRQFYGPQCCVSLTLSCRRFNTVFLHCTLVLVN